MKPSPTAEDRQSRAILYVVGAVIAGAVAFGVFAWVVVWAIVMAAGKVVGLL